MKGGFEIRDVADFQRTILLPFPLAPVKAWGGLRGEAGIAVLHYVCLREWQLCNEGENQSLLWGEKKTLFLQLVPSGFHPLDCTLGARLCLGH